MALTPFTPVPNDRAAGTVDPPGDMNNTSNELAAANGSYNVMNASYAGGADPTGTSDSTAAIQAAYAAVPGTGGPVAWPPGLYKFSSPVSVLPGTTTLGAGAGTVMNYTGSGNAFTCTDSVDVNFRDFILEGPSSGSGAGISFALSSRSNCYQIELSNLLVKNFGSHGVAMVTPIVSRLARVVCQGNGGDGFNLSGGGTSVDFSACYANANTGNGYSLNAQNYSSLHGCASDSAGACGYLLTSCDQVTLAGCGAEVPGTNAFEVSGGYGTSLISCYCTDNSAIGAWITGGAVAAFIQGFHEASVTGSPTASIKVDGSSTALIGINNVITATSFANGTTTIVSNNTFQCPGSTGTSSYIINRLATSNIASLTFETASTGEWNIEMTNNSTNDLLIRDAANGIVAATFEQHSTGENIQLLTGTKSFGGGIGVVGITNAATTPGSSPSGGGVLYVSGGALHWKGSSGTDTTIAPA